MIDKARLLRRFLDLTALSSPSRAEGAVAAYVERWAEELGFAVRRDAAHVAFGGECGNLIVTVPNAAPSPVFLSAHMDTVGPCDRVEPRVEDGWVVSSGESVLGADAKAGMAAAMELAQARAGTGEAPIELVFTAAEEAGLLGSRGLDFSALVARRGFVIDSSQPLGTLIGAAPSESVFDAVVVGRAAHAALHPERGVHAGLIAARAISSCAWGRLSPATTANVGSIHAGEETNVITPEARVTGELRSHDEAELLAAEKTVRAAFRDAAAGAGGKVSLRFTRNYCAYTVSPEEPGVAAFAAAAQALGLPFRSVPTQGGSDVNHFRAAGIEAVNLGYGPEDTHTCRERIRVETLEKLGDLLEGVLERLPAPALA